MATHSTVVFAFSCDEMVVICGDSCQNVPGRKSSFVLVATPSFRRPDSHPNFPFREPLVRRNVYGRRSYCEFGLPGLRRSSSAGISAHHLFGCGPGGRSLGLSRGTQSWGTIDYQWGKPLCCSREGVVESSSELLGGEGESLEDEFESPTTRGVRNGPKLFYDELREAMEALKKTATGGEDLKPLLPTASEAELHFNELLEKDELEGDGYYNPQAEIKHGSKFSKAYWRLDTSKPGKLPIESNGPPMVVLQPYLLPDNSPGVKKEKLPFLPLTMPYQLRPLGLPKASLRLKLGIVSPRKSLPMVQVGNSTKDLTIEIRDLPGESKISTVLNKWVWRLHKGSLIETIQELGRLKLSKKVLQVYRWLRKQSHLWPDYTTLCAIIQVMVEASQVDMAFKLQRKEGSYSLKVTRALAAALTKAGMLSDAVSVLKIMKESEWKIDATVHTKLIQLACCMQQRDIVESLLGDTDLLELNLKLQDYTTILASCSKLGLFDRVEAVYQKFKASGLPPSIIMFTALMSSLSREGKYQEAVALFLEIEKAGCKPDLLAYQVMLDVCAKLGDSDRAVKLFKDMTVSGFEPTSEVYDSLVQLHQKTGLMQVAKELLDEMQSKGYAPSEKTLLFLSSSAVP